MKPFRIILLLLAAVMVSTVAAPGASAQRKVTPVTPAPGTKGTPKEKPELTPYEDPGRLREQTDAQGHIILIDTVTGQEWIDTTAVKKSKKMIYPRIYCVAAGLNIADPLLRIMGQKYGIASGWGELNMHNRYFPTFEFGLGQASITPEEGNFTFRSPIAPYFKIGANYNIFYNSDPRYKFLVGVRYGFTPFSYTIDNVNLVDDYWGTDTQFSIPRQNATVGYFEFLAGVRVNIVRDFSIGWDLRYHAILHENSARYGKPMYIPGYGKRGSALAVNISLVYTFTLNRPAPQEVNSDNEPSKTTP